QGSSGYRVTALLAGQAASAWPPARVEQAHACLFDAIIRRRSISVDQAFPMFMHAFQSADDHRFSHCLTGLVMEDGKSRDIVYERIAPIMFVARGKAAAAESRFSGKNLVLLKLLQFRVAQHQDPSQVADIAREWGEEIARLPDGLMRDGSGLLRAFAIASATEGYFPASMLIQALDELVRVEHLIPPEALPQGLPADLSAGGHEGAGDLVAALFMFMQARCDSIDFQDELLSALEHADPTARSRMLKAFDIPFVRQNHLFADRPWLAEANRDGPRWDFAVATLRRMIELATEWNCAGLGAPAARVLALIYDEHLDNHDEAIACLRDAAIRFGQSPLLIAQEGNALFQRERYKDALELWQKSLGRPSAPIENGVRDPYSLRKAGIAAGLNGDYESASAWFQDAGNLAREMKMPATAGGAWFDAAYCAFKNGAWSRTVALAYAGLDALRNDFDPRDEFALFAAKKLGGHILFWMLGQLRPDFGESAAQPVLGQCSNPDRDKGIADLPSNSFDVSGAMLAEIASLLGVSSDKTTALRTQLEASKIPAAGFQYWSLRCNEAVTSGRFEELAETLMGLSRAHWATLAQQQIGASALAPYTGSMADLDRTATLGLDAVLVGALWLRELDGGSPQLLAAHWAETFSQSPDGRHLQAAAERALLAFSIAGSSARAVFFDRNAEFLARLGAVCRLLTVSSREPGLTARAQSVVSLWLLKSTVRLIFDAMLTPIARHFAAMWRQHLSTPALLISPRISISSLRDAIECTATAPEQLLKLFAAADFATGVGVDKVVREELRKAVTAHAARIPR
ncbi:tetratricopeptide repeat protein, partial [Paraburkholderia sp. BR14261]